MAEKERGREKESNPDIGSGNGGNEGAEGDKVACKQGGGLEMVEREGGARGTQGEVAGGAEGAPGVSKSCRREGQRPGGATEGVPRSWGVRK